MFELVVSLCYLQVGSTVYRCPERDSSGKLNPGSINFDRALNLKKIDIQLTGGCVSVFNTASVALKSKLITA